MVSILGAERGAPPRCSFMILENARPLGLTQAQDTRRCGRRAGANGRAAGDACRIVAVAFPDNGDRGHGPSPAANAREPRGRGHCPCRGQGASDVPEKGCLEVHRFALRGRALCAIGRRYGGRCCRHRRRADRYSDDCDANRTFARKERRDPPERTTPLRIAWAPGLTPMRLSSCLRLRVARAVPCPRQHAGELLGHIAEHRADDHR